MFVCVCVCVSVHTCLRPRLEGEALFSVETLVTKLTHLMTLSDVGASLLLAPPLKAQITGLVAALADTTCTVSGQGSEAVVISMSITKSHYVVSAVSGPTPCVVRSESVHNTF